MSIYKRFILTNTALPWRLRHGLEQAVETQLRARQPAILRKTIGSKQHMPRAGEGDVKRGVGFRKRPRRRVHDLLAGREVFKEIVGIGFRHDAIVLRLADICGQARRIDLAPQTLNEVTMRVLVLGGYGFIGLDASRRLLGAGHEGVALGILRNSLTSFCAVAGTAVKMTKI